LEKKLPLLGVEVILLLEALPHRAVGTLTAVEILPLVRETLLLETLHLLKRSPGWMISM
jgi:hypothetical protein